MGITFDMLGTIDDPNHAHKDKTHKYEGDKYLKPKQS